MVTGLTYIVIRLGTKFFSELVGVAQVDAPLLGTQGQF